MSKTARSKAEEQFTATQKKDKQFLQEKESARNERAEGVAKLKALRQAKEIADKEIADAAEAEKAAKVAAKKKKKKA